MSSDGDCILPSDSPVDYTLAFHRLLSVAHQDGLTVKDLLDLRHGGTGPQLIADCPYDLAWFQPQFGNLGLLAHQEVLSDVPDEIVANLFQPSPDNRVLPKEMVPSLCHCVVSRSETGWEARAVDTFRRF